MVYYRDGDTFWCPILVRLSRNSSSCLVRGQVDIAETASLEQASIFGFFVLTGRVHLQAANRPPRSRTRYTPQVSHSLEAPMAISIWSMPSNPGGRRFNSRLLSKLVRIQSKEEDV